MQSLVKSPTAISNFLIIEDALTPADIVFIPGSTQTSLIDRAIELIQLGMAQKIIVAGRSPKPLGAHERSECDILCEYALNKGVSDDLLMREDKSSNTLENIIFGGEVIDRNLNWQTIRSVTIVCKNFHCRRVQMTAEKHWPSHVLLQFAPVDASIDGQSITAKNWHQLDTSRRRVLEELSRISEYSLKGDIGRFS
jgi:uncharacterized SAM-binding protein YcdF (DUF218 family)